VLDKGKCIDFKENDDGKINIESVTEQYFNAAEKLSEKLKHRILASIISDMHDEIWKDGRLDKDTRFTDLLSADEKNWKLAEIIINRQLGSDITSPMLETLGETFQSNALDVAISDFGKCLQDQFKIIEEENSRGTNQS
jgi:hypothetical protein